MGASRRGWPVWVRILCASTWTRSGNAHGGMAYVGVGSRTLAVRAVASTAARMYDLGVMAKSPSGFGVAGRARLQPGSTTISVGSRRLASFLPSLDHSPRRGGAGQRDQ